MASPETVQTFAPEQFERARALIADVQERAKKTAISEIQIMRDAIKTGCDQADSILAMMQAQIEAKFDAGKEPIDTLLRLAEDTTRKATQMAIDLKLISEPPPSPTLALDDGADPPRTLRDRKNGNGSGHHL